MAYVLGGGYPASKGWSQRTEDLAHELAKRWNTHGEARSIVGDCYDYLAMRAAGMDMAPDALNKFAARVLQTHKAMSGDAPAVAPAPGLMDEVRRVLTRCLPYINDGASPEFKAEARAILAKIGGAT